MIAAAADLTALEPELARHASLRFVTGASATLAQQIENGAPYDVFLSANARFVDDLASKRKIEPNSVKAYAIGRVGVLWRDGKPHRIRDLAQNWVRFVALPNPQLAPYGVAAQQALEHAGLWEFVRQKAVYGENVRQALQLFESGNADAVLTSAALLQDKNPQVIPPDWHQPIIQKAGIVSASPNQAEAQKFLDFLLSPAGQAIFAKFGFSPPNQ
ncbi:MAG: molybdate ABC transporter substrate-binding protein [Acidobacteriaceae bacterium]|nr:molybdate ABC transporter substrate-binding protein [Acidobacteriaceae bacterium]MBV9296692.1 molybdate ABC transporter substrate-binding protein [Acidobacteriaceae bacterium]MBV9763938.1 molybdate ABC transporter substrate-binding protein [Acidobacteriaceae bacterium]